MALTAQQEAWLSLALIPGVGSTKFIRLLARFGTPAQVLRAPQRHLEDVVGPVLAERICAYKSVVDIDQQRYRLEQYQATVITMDDGAYPPLLAEVYDPPLVLFCRGQLLEEDRGAVAVVGTRKPSAYGQRMAEELSAGLGGRGITVVSGLAEGIDTAAHRGALNSGGRTIAVLGCGVDHVYPVENAALMHEIVQQGCVLSPFPMGIKPSRGHFPYRNRTISGLCQGTVVVEAPPQSGALLTARNAGEQGREIFAVPGQAGHRNSQGPHSLIREGAKLVESVEDILVELDWSERPRQANAPREAVPALKPAAGGTPPVPAAAKTAPPSPTPAPASPPAGLSQPEARIFHILGSEGQFVDTIAQRCALSVSETLSSLTLLELKGLVRQYSGKRFARR